MVSLLYGVAENVLESSSAKTRSDCRSSLNCSSIWVPHCLSLSWHLIVNNVGKYMQQTAFSDALIHIQAI